MPGTTFDNSCLVLFSDIHKDYGNLEIFGDDSNIETIQLTAKYEEAAKKMQIDTEKSLRNTGF